MKVKMKTGNEQTNRNLPESFYILLLGLDAILKRDSFKNAIHYKQHNPPIEVSSELFASAVAFNLFSDYGVGKKLEPLIFELFSTLHLDSDKHENNIFFLEIVLLSNVILPLIRKCDSKEEVLLTYSYAIENLNRVDALAVERMERLMALFSDDLVDELSEDENSDEDEDKACYCGFCKKFREYHFPREEYAEKIILNALLDIDLKTRN